jgi:hypothetical protein
MATYNHFKYSASPIGNPTTSEPFIIQAVLDFGGDHWSGVSGTNESVLRPLQAADVVRLAELKDHWIIKNSWYRVRNTFTGTMTVDIGTDVSQTAIADDLDVTAAGDWVQGTIGKDTNGTTGAHVILGADGYLQVLINNNPPANGRLEVMIEVVIGDLEQADGN